MTLALSGNSLLAVGGSLATGCCCDDPDEGGYWWCVNGRCLQSELAPDDIYAGRYLTRAACERRCLDGAPKRCGCCSYPNPLSGECEPCEEACSLPDGTPCDTDCDPDDPQSENCQCDKHTRCREHNECGCCMRCVDQDLAGIGRCVPCPDDTVCVDPSGEGYNCTCVSFEECEEFPLVCADPRKPPGFGYECTRNLCGEGDCSLRRGGTYPQRWQCLRACRDQALDDCGITKIRTTGGELGQVTWVDEHYSVQIAKAEIMVGWRARLTGQFRILIMAPSLDRECRVIATSVVKRDTMWHRVSAPCAQCEGDGEEGQKDRKCEARDPTKPYCCRNQCQQEPCLCRRCKKNRNKQCKKTTGGVLTWTKPRGVTSFTVRILRDKDCAQPEVCIKVGCKSNPPRFFQGECQNNEPVGYCCFDDFSCKPLLECECKEQGGKFTASPFPCEDPYFCCMNHASCAPTGTCPPPCCCPDGGGQCRRTCQYPPCCTAGGCFEEVPASLCVALGGTSMTGLTKCTAGLCCPIKGANDCANGYFCCGNGTSGVCCESTKCCIGGACVAPDANPCPACQERVGPQCNKQCRPCEQGGKICCGGVCHVPPCPCPQGQFRCGNTCCPNGQFCVNGQCSPCPAGKIVCGNNCCNPDQFCVNGQCRQCETIPCAENPDCEACKGTIGPTCSACDLNTAQQQCAGLQAACAQLGGTFFQGQSEWDGETIPVCMCLNACLGYDKTEEQCTALSNNYWQFGGAFFSLLANGCQPDGCCPPCEGA